MKLSIFFFFVVSCLSTKFVEKTIDSKILNQKMKYAVYFPEGYSADKKYPILYALHGMGTDHTCYVIAEKEIDEAIKQKILKPSIIVTPQAFNSFYINSQDGAAQAMDMSTDTFEDYFFNEFIPHIEKTYPTESTKSMRAILGISMGGFGAAYYSLVKKDYFSSTVAMSPALLPENGFTLINSIDEVRETFIDLINAFGNDDYYNEHNFNYIVKNKPKGTFKTPLYGCIGKQDFLYNFVNPSTQVMKEYEMNYVWDDDDVGAHEVSYWLQKMPKALSFIEKNWTENKAFLSSILLVLLLILIL